MDTTINPYYASYNFPPVMSKEEESEIGSKLSSENENERELAQDEFVNRNLRLVIKIASGYSKCGLELDDMISEGNIGLMEAAKRYDPERGAKFSTYAAFWIRQKITRALCNHGRLIRLPVQLVQIQLKVLKYLEKYEKANDDPPSHEKIANDLEEPIRLIKKVLNVKYFYQSLDATLDKDSEGVRVDGGKMKNTGGSFGSVMKDEKTESPLESLVKADHKDMINKFLEGLKYRERYIIEHRFGLNDKDVKTLESIGEEFNVTRERIRQVEFEAIKKLRFQINKVY
jgi:RNA polymerase primary sigma factor